jgi:RNA polymerase sigma factor (sigma-70 family)
MACNVSSQNEYRVPAIRQSAREFDVSIRPPSCRRRRGLVSRRFIFDVHRRVGFLPGSVGRCTLRTRRPVSRGTCSSQMTEAERTSIVERARAILDLALQYVPHEQFHAWEEDKNAETEVLGPIPGDSEPAGRPSSPAGRSAYLAALDQVPLLTREQELHLFRKMNYLKYNACKLRQQLNPSRPRISLVKRIERLYEEIVATRNQIIRANLGLVVSIARRYVGPAHDFFEVVSDGNVTLMRAVDRFNFALGNKFSTYASCAIINNYASTVPKTLRQRDRFRTGYPEVFSAAEDTRPDRRELELMQPHREKTVERILRQLNKREQEIITLRFGLRPEQEPLTLKQIGAVMGVTKERIRQIETGALKKLRAAIEAIDTCP